MRYRVIHKQIVIDSSVPYIQWSTPTRPKKASVAAVLVNFEVTLGSPVML